ncbi:RsmE family RNA methyltransferase [Spiroplasma culicicola]|uniref:Ribosomal RNA small subunit methyltransferase E n=1 Tax=Spiroplasma culicicola AES-1 TaxID=1276246 RepID=W6A6Y6_9MOLU|nr:RsmE family RNA methyltransferase [Spiroplasma culicicola]AHI52747.1 16S ribosomal RNA methyltransferase RsmE [Spiroplasma culicicola AES-1]
MHSFFVDKKIDDSFIIEGQDVHHIKNVIKLKLTQQVYCIYQSEKYLCLLETIEIDQCIVKIIEKIESDIKKVTINLFAGIIREQKWDFLLQKATEIGVDNIYPVIFKRNVVQVEPKKEESKIARWQSICKEAAKQSKRVNIPVVHKVIRTIPGISKIEADLKLVAWEETVKNSLKNQLQTDFQTINIVVGPEGGIDASEIAQLEQLNYHVVGLGNNILRAETASLYLLSTIMYEKH